MNIAIIGGLNWFGKGMLDATTGYNYVFNIIDNCSSPNSCKTLFENQDRYIHCSVVNLRQIIKQSQFVIFNISSKLEAMNVEDLAKILIDSKKTSLLDF